MTKFDSVLFDLDGTLWDASDTTAESWARVLAAHPEAEPAVALDAENLRRFMGLTNEELTEIVFPSLDFDTAFSLFEETCEIENSLLYERGGLLFEGVRELFETLTGVGIKLFIVSNCQAGYIESFLHAHGFEKYICDFESSGNSGKPKGENIRDIVRRNGLCSPVFLGDTSSDSRGAAFAGVPFVYARYGLGESYGRGRVDKYDTAVDSPLELLRVMEV